MGFSIIKHILKYFLLIIIVIKIIEVLQNFYTKKKFVDHLGHETLSQSLL